jgi:hypothetical protein
MLRALAEGKVEPHPAGAAGHLIDRGDQTPLLYGRSRLSIGPVSADHCSHPGADHCSRLVVSLLTLDCPGPERLALRNASTTRLSWATSLECFVSDARADLCGPVGWG